MELHLIAAGYLPPPQFLKGGKKEEAIQNLADAGSHCSN